MYFEPRGQVQNLDNDEPIADAGTVRLIRLPQGPKSSMAHFYPFRSTVPLFFDMLLDVGDLERHPCRIMMLLHQWS